jgi:uncharacterized membrane protein
MTKKHIFIMLACCLFPIAIFGASLILKISVNTVLLLALVLVCPLSHLLLMKYLGHDHQIKRNLSSKEK